MYIGMDTLWNKDIDYMYIGMDTLQNKDMGYIQFKTPFGI